MNIEFELIIIPKLVVAFGLGLFIGLDRERQGKDAGIRTYAAVCLGATLFTTIAENIDDDVTSVSRIVANIVTGNLYILRIAGDE